MKLYQKWTLVNDTFLKGWQIVGTRMSDRESTKLNPFCNLESRLKPDRTQCLSQKLNFNHHRETKLLSACVKCRVYLSFIKKLIVSTFYRVEGVDTGPIYFKLKGKICWLKALIYVVMRIFLIIRLQQDRVKWRELFFFLASKFLV